MAQVDYEHYIPDVKEKPEFPGCNTHILITSIEELKKALDNPSKYMAWDTETSSLDPSTGQLVGFSFSFDGKIGYYVPLNHYMGDNLPFREALDLFYEKMKQVSMNFLFNCRFDMRFCEYQGYDLSVIKYYDVAVGCWLSDTNVKFPSLKGSEKKFLGWIPSTFEETLGDNTSFMFLDVKDAYQYACVDAEGTFATCMATVRFYKEAKMAGKFENESLYPLMKFEEETLDVDMEYLRQCILEESMKLHEIQQEIYRIFGFQIKLNSSKQLGDALQQLGIHTGEYTASGQMKVDIKTLERVNLHNPHPVLGMIIEQSQINKSLNSYFESLLKEAERMHGKARFNYLTNNVPTARLACGADKKNPFFTHLNVQSAPKPHPQDWYVHDYKEGDDVFDGEIVIMRWLFSTKRESNRIIEGFNQKNNFRSAFKVADDELWLSCDYSGQELRAIANVSGEPGWVNTFLTGGDLHKQQAVAMWGEENYDKEKRKRAKVLNFGMAYGMSGYSLSQKFNVSVEEGEDIVAKFWKAAPRIKEYQNRCVKMARKNGTIYNYFGLPRRVKFYLNHSDPKKRAFGVRTVNNTQIQSVGACLLKLAIIKLGKKILNPEMHKLIRFQTTVHDEINFACKADKIEELSKLVRSCMRVEIPGWKVPFEIGTEIGHRWGATFPFKYDENDNLVPDCKEID